MGLQGRPCVLAECIAYSYQERNHKHPEMQGLKAWYQTGLGPLGSAPCVLSVLGVPAPCSGALSLGWDHSFHCSKGDLKASCLKFHFHLY